MKILFFNSNKIWGGGEKWNLETASDFHKKGKSVIILASPSGNLFKRSLQEDLETLPVFISNLSFINPFLLVRLYRMFRRIRPDVVILMLPSDLKAGGLAARMAGISKIIYRRDIALPMKNSFLNRFLFRKVITDVVTNSSETKQKLLEHNSRLVPAGNLHVIYNGINLDIYDQVPFTSQHSKPDGYIYFGTAGRLEPEKNQQALIQIANILKSKELSFKILIAGEGSLKAHLQDLAMAEGVSDHIQFLGFVEPIRSFMQLIDIFILPSHYEGFGFVSIEAMACNKPVVAFDTSSNPEVILDEETGYLVKPGDIHELTEKLLILAKSMELRLKMGENGRKRVEKFFTMRESLHQFGKVLH